MLRNVGVPPITLPCILSLLPLETLLLGTLAFDLCIPALLLRLHPLHFALRPISVRLSKANGRERGQNDRWNGKQSHVAHPKHF